MHVICRMGGSENNIYVVGPVTNALILDGHYNSSVKETIAALETAGIKIGCVRAVVITHQSRAGPSARVDRVLREGDVIEHEGLTLEVLHIPGHDRSEIARFERKRRWVFSGDLAQREGPGWLGLFTDVTSQRRSFDIPDKEGVPASSHRHEVIPVVAE